MSEGCSDVRVPEEALQDEHGQTQNVAVALQGDQLPENSLRMDNISLKKRLKNTSMIKYICKITVGDTNKKLQQMEN